MHFSLTNFTHSRLSQKPFLELEKKNFFSAKKKLFKHIAFFLQGFFFKRNFICSKTFFFEKPEIFNLKVLPLLILNKGKFYLIINFKNFKTPKIHD